MVGLPADWACMTFGGGGNTAGKEGFALNFFGAGGIDAPFEAGGSLTIEQTTEYPVGDGSVSIALSTAGSAPAHFDLWLRIPCWSKRTSVRLNSKPLPTPTPGQYLHLGLDSASKNTIDLQLDFRVRCWLQPQTQASSEATGAPEPSAPEPCATGAAELPKPMWTSAGAGWTDDRKTLAANGSDVIVVPGDAPIQAGATTGCAWFGGVSWFAAGNDHLKDMIPFSFGAKDTGPGFSRALALSQGQVEYYAFEGNKPAGRDLISIIDGKHVPTWNAALRDGRWHHIAVTDDGKKVTLLLDGSVIGGGTHRSPPTTSAGAIIGGWGIARDRNYAGGLAGVELYTACLSSEQVGSVMARTKPSGPPPPTPRMGCFYRGPILLGLDPCYNLQTTTLTPAFDPTKLSSPKVCKAGMRFIEPALLVEVPTADGSPVRLCDYASLGLTGTRFSTWFEVTAPAGVTLPKDTPFTRADPTRTFFVDSLKADSAHSHPLRVKLTVADGVGRIQTRRFQSYDASAGLHDFLREVNSVAAVPEGLASVEYMTCGSESGGDGWRALASEAAWRACVGSAAGGVVRVRCSVDASRCVLCA